MENINRFLEWCGGAMAAAGFLMVMLGYGLQGATVGLISCFVLVTYFWRTGQTGMFSLQSYFMFANIIGILNFTGVF